MRRGIPSLAVVVACLGLAACGGSGGSATTAVSTTTAATQPAGTAFAAQLSSTCRRANAAYNAATKQSAQVAVIQHYVGVFRALKAPPLMRATYAAYVDVLAQELADLKRGDAAGLIKLRDTKAGPLVRQLGATGCYG